MVDRLAPPAPHGLWAWVAPLAVAGLGGWLRLYRLGAPKAVVFDETYYAKDAYSLLKHGYERSTVEGADEKLLDGQTDIFTGDPSFIVHPPAGKWVIAAGEQIGGLTPFGWRLGVAVVGALSIFLLARIAMRLTRSILLGCVAGLLLALDGLHYVMSRTALLDGILAFFILAAFGCLIVDRDRARRRMAAQMSESPGRHGRPAASKRPRWLRIDRFGPRFGLRPWRIAAGICLGLALGTKWNALYFIAVFGILAAVWDASLRKVVGVLHPIRSMLRMDAVPAVLSLVLVPVVVYVSTWSGWLASSSAWDRNWAQGRGGFYGFIPDPLRSLWHYHGAIYDFHTGLTTDHSYQSNPWSWLVLGRPVSYYFTSHERGDQGCEVEKCVRSVLGIGTPVLWWISIIALLYMLWRWLGERDWRAGAILAGVAAGWLPWFMYQGRPIFLFYAVVFLPFLVLAVTLMLGAILGGPDAGRKRRAWGAVGAGTVVLAVAVNFFYMYPILSAQLIPYGEWASRMWFRSWI